MDCNPTICREKWITRQSKSKVRFNEMSSRHYNVSVLMNHHQDL